MKRPERSSREGVSPRGDRERASEVEVVACPDCGLRQQLEPIPDGFHAECRRCRKPLARSRSLRLDAALALLAAAVLTFIPACLAPLLVVHADGAVRESVLTTGIGALWTGGFRSLAVVVAAFSIAVPAAYLVLMTGVLAVVRFVSPRRLRAAAAPRLGLVFRCALGLRPWMMIEVYLLGACVAYSRMQAVAFVSVGTAAWCLVAASLLVLLADATLDPRAIWQRLPLPQPPRAAAANAAAATATAASATPASATPASAAVASASEAGAADAHAPGRRSSLACTACDLVVAGAGPGDRCPRCRARLSVRKPLSVQRTWALVLCGFILFIPANLLPVLTIEQFGREDPNTILGGVRELVRYHLWPLAAIVFLASIAIPLAKLCGLSWNLFLTQRGSARFLVGRTRLHRAIDVIGRWSNIDVFMLSILVAVVRFGELTRVRAETGMIAFAAVVIVTMLAAKSFDSRLMWDAAGERA